MNKSPKTPPTLLIVLDGLGYSTEKAGNAFAEAQMPNFNKWQDQYPSALLAAAGEAVGLLPGYIGNSEVGHLTLGAGRVVPSVLAQLHGMIADGSLGKNELLKKSFEGLKSSGKALHLMGLLSDAGVHSHQDHLHALIELAHEKGIEQIFVHAFLDGRDTPPKSAAAFLKKLEAVCKKSSAAIASLHGRFYAMDRDHNWERTNKTFELLCGEDASDVSWHKALEAAYAKGETDEFVTPVMLKGGTSITDGDGIIFWNFRPDRAIQLTNAFHKSATPKEAFFISPVRYREDFTNDVLIPARTIANTLLDVLATHDKKVFLIAETEKYAHVTYFFRGMVDKELPSETRVLVPSLKLENYVEQPEMSAPEITQNVLDHLKEEPADFYLINYANADMVGHSGDMAATVKALECLDEQLDTLYKEVVEKQGGTMIVTADHGNAEEMVDSKSITPRTAHTKNPVILLIICPGFDKDTEEFYGFSMDREKVSGGLKDVALLILRHLDLPIPNEMN